MNSRDGVLFKFGLSESALLPIKSMQWEKIVCVMYQAKKKYEKKRQSKKLERNKGIVGWFQKVYGIKWLYLMSHITVTLSLSHQGFSSLQWLNNIHYTTFSANEHKQGLRTTFTRQSPTARQPRQSIHNKHTHTGYHITGLRVQASDNKNGPKQCPNDVSHIVWALGEHFLPFFSSF